MARDPLPPMGTDVSELVAQLERLIEEHQPISLGQLAYHANLTMTDTSKLVKAMQRAGTVTCNKKRYTTTTYETVKTVELNTVSEPDPDMKR